MKLFSHIFFTLGLLLPHLAGAAPVHEGYYQKYCVECHGPKNAEAELDLTQLLEDPDRFPQNDKILTQVFDVIDFEEMPPAKFKHQPSPAERQVMTQWTQATLDRIEQQQRNDPGLVVMPRLTQTEYDRVMRDLTGQSISASHLLPAEGGAGEGFSNVGEAQAISLTQLEKYLASAKYVLRHLIATPHGWTWARLPLKKAETREEVVDNLLGMIRQWYVDEEKASEHGQRQLEKEYGSPTAAYLEAAWHYRFRQALGYGDLSPAEVATKVSGTLQPIILEKWLRVLSSKPDELPSLARPVIEHWLSIPAPGEQPEGERLAAMRDLGDLLSSVKTRGWQLKFAPGFEVSYKGEDDREAVHESADQGIWPFTLQLGNREALYLTLTPAGETSPDDKIVWEKGEFIFEDGSTRSWKASLREAEIVTGQVRGEQIGDEPVLVAEAPAVVRIPVPDGAKKMKLQARIPEENFPAAIVQAMVLDEALPLSQLIMHPERRPVHDIGHDSVKAWLDEIGDSRDLARDSIKYDKSPAPIAGQLDEAVIQKLDLKNPDFSEESKNPFAFGPKELIAIAEESDRERLLEFYANLASLAEERDPAALHQIAMDQIGPWMVRAWRRPVTRQEADEVLLLFDRALAKGESYDAALKQSLAAVMLSPHFVYRHPENIEVAAGTYKRPLTGLELANRLSFIIWGSIPDEELLRLGASGELRNSDVLQNQADRMLADPRAKALADEFSGQWFRFHGFADFREPDNKVFPEFKPEIAEAMFEEVRYFFDDLIRNDRSILRVLDADYTFVNEELAEYYDLPQKVEGGMQKVSLEGTPRRGVATMGMVLTKTSSAMRTSPVKRGVYIIEEILGEHLPNPPAGVPPLSDGERNKEGQTITEQLAVHRDNPSCSGCHSKFDPLGIALENFDGIGRWRDVDSQGEPLATTDTLPDGTTLEGAAALTDYLASQKDRFVQHFCRKLLGYMLGRGVQAGDRALLNKMARELETNDYRFSAALDAVLESPQFLERRWTPADPGIAQSE